MYKKIYKVALPLFVFLFLVPYRPACKVRVVRILVTSPHIGNKIYRPIADVMAGSIIRELIRYGGLEIIDREASEKYLKEKGLDEWVNTRALAIEIGEVLNADIVIYSSLGKHYELFKYSIAFLEIERDLIQRITHGTFKESDTPAHISYKMGIEVAKLVKYIPTPSELEDRAITFREVTVAPDNLPERSIIEEFPQANHGVTEQILSYYRIFPGEVEYYKLAQQRRITRFEMREDMDMALTRLFNKLRVYAEFGLRHNMQVYFIKDCSVRAINVLLANKIPVVYSETGESVNVLIGYSGLRPDGYCYFIPFGSKLFDSYDFTHRQRVAIMIMLPKPGRKGGISKKYLEEAVGQYKDEWGKTPTLVEIKEGFLDIMSTRVE